MKIADVLEVAGRNFRRRFKSNVCLIIIFVLVIIVFNCTYTLATTLTENANTQIVGNQNLKIINVSTILDEISQEEMAYISNVSHVEMVVYNYCLSICVEDNKGTDAMVIGMNGQQASYLVGEKVALEKDDIIVNTSFAETGYQIGDAIEISYNARVSEASGVREHKKCTIVSVYEQPVVETWYDNVMIVSEDNVFEIASKLYGVSAQDVAESNLYKQSALVFVDEVENVTAVAEAIETKGLITSYALAYSQELPLFAKMIIGIGAVMIVIMLIMGMIIMNVTLNNSIRNRYKEIGILKAVGMNGRHIFEILSAEVFLLWAFISIIAIICSFFIINMLSTFINLSSVGKLEIGVLQIMLSVIVTYVIMFFTTLLTIKRASELKTVEVLRNA